MPSPRRRPFRFGAFATRIASASTWRDLARTLEGLGYATLFTPDHLGHQGAIDRPRTMPANPWLHPMMALTMAAASTTTLRVGTFVSNNGMTHPALLAREAATLDILSEGRLELG